MVRKYESPSSINTFRQCPRKYFYAYIRKLPTLPNIHLIRGNAAHKALEDFYDIDLEVLDRLTAHDFEVVLREHVRKILHSYWKAAMPDFKKLNLPHDQHIFYYRETKEMIQNYMTLFLDRLKIKIVEMGSIGEAFRVLVPVREKRFYSDEFNVQGFIDVIEEFDGKVRLMDYKTSRNAHIGDAYRLQLAIYALLYNEQYGRLPDAVGIYFLKADEQVMDVDDGLIEFAKEECRLIRERTQSEDMADYPKKESPLCKWSTGQCDFYEHCFGEDS